MYNLVCTQSLAFLSELEKTKCSFTEIVAFVNNCYIHIYIHQWFVVLTSWYLVISKEKYELFCS